jgi:hypothetical protein
MQQFHESIVDLQRKEEVRVIQPPHALGFLDPNLPPRNAATSHSTLSSKAPSDGK